MAQLKALKTSAQVTVAAVAGALASVFFSKWIDMTNLLISFILILLYTSVIFIVLYFFFRK